MKGNLDVLAAPYAEDAVFILSNGTAVRGKAAIKALYAKHRGQVHVVRSTTKSDGRVAVTPDDVYEWGNSWETVSGAGGKLHRGGGRYLTVWHRQDNRWLITRNISF